MKNSSINNQRFYKTAVFLLFLINFCISFLFIDSLPGFIHVDEAGTILNAFSILTRGMDRHGSVMPIYPVNYVYSGQSFLATYLTAAFISLFGYSLFSARLVYSLFSFAAAFFVYGTFKENRKIALISLLLYTVWPFRIMSSRFVLDCNLFFYVLIIAFYFLIRYQKNHNTLQLLLSGIFFGVSFYTYALSYIIIPAVLLIYAGYMFIKKKCSIKELILFFIPVVILGIPLLLRLLVDYGFLEEFKLFGFTINRLMNDRSGEIGLSNVSIDHFISLVKAIFINDRFKVLSFRFGGPVFYLPLILIFIYSYQIFTASRKIDGEDVFLISLFILTFLVGMILDETVTWRMNSIYLSLLYISSFVISSFDKKLLSISIGLNILLFAVFSGNYILNYNKGYNSVMFDSGLYDSYVFAKTLDKKDIYVKNSRLGEEYVYYFLFDENIVLNDYPDEYPVEGFTDSRNNKTIHLDLDGLDSDSVYIVFEQNEDEVSQMFSNHSTFNCWTVYYN